MKKVKVKKNNNTEIIINPPLENNGSNPNDTLNVTEDVAVITFGRMNPPTKGHEFLVSKLLETAIEENGVPMVFLSKSENNERNPLLYEEKKVWTKEIFGENIIKDYEGRTFINVLEELNGKFSKLHIILGEDREEEMLNLIKKYNGNLYQFEEVKATILKRDPASEDIFGISGFKARAAAKKGDKEKLKKLLPSALDNKKLYNLIQIMQNYINEETKEKGFRDYINKVE
jgi:citrate lyase synthetase